MEVQLLTFVCHICLLTILGRHLFADIFLEGLCIWDTTWCRRIHISEETWCQAPQLGGAWFVIDVGLL